MNKFCFTFIANFADFLAMVDYMVHFSADLRYSPGT